MMYLFHSVTQRCSRLITEHYSTSFSSAVRLLHKDLRNPIHNIYGFVRFADEIVDSFHDYDKRALLSMFREETYAALERSVHILEKRIRIPHYRKLMIVARAGVKNQIKLI